MRRTTKIMIGVFAGTIVAVVASIGIFSRSNFVIGKKQTQDDFFKEVRVDASKVKTIVLKTPDKNLELPGEMIIRAGDTDNRPGTLCYMARMEEYLKQEIKGDTLFLSLVPGIRTTGEVVRKIGLARIKLYAGPVTDVIDGWSLHTTVTGLKADTLKLKSNAKVELDSCDLRVIRLEQAHGTEVASGR